MVTASVVAKPYEAGITYEFSNVVGPNPKYTLVFTHINGVALWTYDIDSVGVFNVPELATDI
jgi:hypothetical protein